MHRRHVLGVFTVSEHRDEVASRILETLLPESRKVLEAFQQAFTALLFRFDQTAGLGHSKRDIGPVGQLAAIFQREVKKRRQHQGGQLDGNIVDPVEGLALGQ